MGIKVFNADFYPRSPCGERHLTKYHFTLLFIFLSTLSLRRATTDAINGCNSDIISIHALLAESDVSKALQGFLCLKFLSTLSLRRATVDCYAIRHILAHISIHALLAESDESQQPCGHPTRDFYPRSPCGERQYAYKGV